ncbi:MAG: hypothetical protein RJB66_1830 [Pseudomonadota bacterium]
MAKEPILRVENLETTFTLREGSFRAVNGISYHINAAEILGIVGESGSGKTVTSYSLLKLIEPPGKITGGKIFFKGRDLLQLHDVEMQDVRGKEIAIIFQEPSTALNPILSIGFQIDEQILRHENVSKKEARHRSIDLLKLVGIPNPEERYHQYIHQLSGGMRQRAMIAMALSCNPSLLIADEPTTALDVTIQSQILELLQSLQESRGMSVQFITHDLGVISELCDRVLVMYGGQIAEAATTEELFRQPHHPYTIALLEAIPRLGTVGKKLPTIEGTIPSPLDLPKGCAFFNRCPRAKPECQTLRPPTVAISQTHSVACFNPH